MDRALEIASALARRFEGFYPIPYLCPAGVPTIGFGATFYEDGTRVKLTDPPITRERADGLLLWQVQMRFLPVVLRLCPGVNSPERLAALIDFAFNLGSARLKTSTLRRRVNAGRWDVVPSELLKWNMSGGRVLAGLTRRRRAEVELV